MRHERHGSGGGREEVEEEEEEHHQAQQQRDGVTHFLAGSRWKQEREPKGGEGWVGEGEKKVEKKL